MTPRTAAILHLIPGMVLGLTLAAAGPAGQAAEKKEMSYVKTDSRSISKSSFAIGDAASHEVVQELMLQKSKWSAGGFDPVEEWIHSQTDQTDGTGTHKGYYIEIHANGDQTYGTFDGTHKTVVKDDGSWSSTWSGTYRYVGGSGKYKNIKGGGTYKGRASPQEPFYEEGRQTIEY